MLKIRFNRFFIISIACLLFFINGNFALAESVDLGSFSLQTANEKFLQDIPLKVGDFTYPLSADTIRGFIREKETLVYNSGYRSEIENPHYCDFKKSILCGLLFSAHQEPHIQKISHVYLDTDPVSRFIEDLARQTDRDPENATFQAGEEGKISVFSLSKEGVTLNKEKSLEILTKYFKSAQTSDTVELAFDTIQPEISTDSIDNLGITALIGQGKSNFAGSPKNRIFNIKVAVNRFNGLMIKPGEEFSFVKNLGEVDAEHGYLPELVIKNNKTEPEFGGGICQVSTTAFRAAIFSGLKITARKNHAYPVQYYTPHGMDATIYIPYPDLRFVNNTPGYILIQARIVGTELFFDFYGTPDGRKITVTGPTILERNPDGSMKTTFTQEVVDEDGAGIIKDVFNSSYDSPDKYPHPGEVLTQKPKDWSEREWKVYKKEHNL